MRGLTGNRGDLTLVLRNYTDEPQPLQVELLQEDGTGYDEARVLRREFEVPPPADDEAAGVVRHADVVPLQRYLVFVRLKVGRGGWHHYHFIPGRTGSAQLDLRVYRADDTGELYTRCY